MKVIRDEIALCSECMIAAVNGDLTGLDYYYREPRASERMAEIIGGLEKLGPNLVPDFDTETGRGYEEFSTRRCDCCDCKLHGSRHMFAILG